MIILFILAVLVVMPAIAALTLEGWPLSGAPFAVGAPVVYQREVVSNQPCSGARDVRPSEHGEFYYYSLVNYLRVTEVLGDGRIIAVSRDNNRVYLSPNDSQLRKARLTERFIYRWRFPRP